MKKVLVFGTFDGLHEGHRRFLEQARALGSRLIAVVATDETAEILKGKRPKRSLAERLDILLVSDLADEVEPGDTAIGAWSAVKRHGPEIIAIGYDQNTLKTALEKFLEGSKLNVTVRVMAPHEPERFHSSLLNP